MKSQQPPKKKKIKRNFSEASQQWRREHMKQPEFDQYRGLDAMRINISFNLSEAYYIQREQKRRQTSLSEIVRSCVDYIIDNKILID